MPPHGSPASTTPTATTPAEWPPFWPMQTQRAVADMLGMHCQTPGENRVRCDLSQSSGVSLESEGPDGTVANDRELSFSVSGRPNSATSEAHRMFAAVADAVTGDAVLSAAWQERIWANFASQDWRTTMLPNGAGWSIFSFGIGADQTSWVLYLMWETSTEPTPVPSASPTPAPTPVDWQAFDEQAREACLAAGPARLKTMEAPVEPIDRAPTYHKVRVVRVEVLGPDRTSSPFPLDLLFAYWAEPPASLDFIAAAPAEVELLACVALRTAESATYYNDGVVPPEVTLYRVDTILWMVDATSGEPVGRPWVFLDREAFPRERDWGSWEESGTLALLVHAYNSYDVCHRSVAWDIREFLGQDVPGPGCY